MKKLLLIMLLAIGSGMGHAQIVTIPDANFKAKLIAEGVDTNTDGEIQVSEAEATVFLDINTASINDLEGIQFFTNLETLYCSGNFITTLDVRSNTSLTALYFAGSPLLETVYLKNGSDESSNLDAGSWLENFIINNNPNLIFVCADQFQVAEIQALAGNAYPVNSYCSLPPGGDYNTITGVAKFDVDSNGCSSTDVDIPYMGFGVDLGTTNTNSMVFTNNTGIYNLYVGQTGTYFLHPMLENPAYFSVTPDPADVPIPTIDNGTTTQDFCITATGVHPDLEVALGSIFPPQPGFDAIYKLVFKNKGNQTLSGNVTFNFDDSILDFISSTTPPDAQTVGQLSFNFSDLHPFQAQAVEITLNVNGPTETPPVNIGDPLSFTSTINPTTGDETPDDNTFVFNQLVVGSYDPNNMMCLQGDIAPVTAIGDYLHYLINFENTGNAAATTVVITSEINPEDFDITSLQVLNASHPLDYKIEENNITFTFQNIMLDSGGHGNILLKMKTNSDLEVNDFVNARANIYFDFNFPIETNETNTTFMLLGATNQILKEPIAMYPNPATNFIHIQANTAIEQVVVIDMQGRKVKMANPNSNFTELDISDMATGVYFIRIKTPKTEQVHKIIKE